MSKCGACWSIVMVVVVGCAGPKAPQPEPSVTPSAAAAVAESPAATSDSTGLSSGFQTATTAALKFIGESLRRGATHNSEPEFNADLAEARRLVKTVRDAATTDADQRVGLLLTLLLAKDKERYEAMLLSSVHGASYESVQGTIQQLYAEREGCADELRGWLGQTARTEEELASGPCLAQAEQAGAALGIRR